jgi:hypothetical protein
MLEAASNLGLPDPKKTHQTCQRGTKGNTLFANIKVLKKKKESYFNKYSKYQKCIGHTILSGYVDG